MASTLPKDWINVEDLQLAGQRLVVGDPNAAQTNSRIIKNAVAAIPGATSQRWLFGGGVYHFSETFHIDRPLWLEGVGGSNQHPRTVFSFPTGAHGLHIHGPAQGTTASNDTDAQGAGVTNIRLTARGKTTVAHGVLVESMCSLSHMYIENFRGDGIHALCSLPQSNASLSRFDNIFVAGCGSVDLPIGIGGAVNVKTMQRTNQTLTITTTGPNPLVKGSVVSLSPAPGQQPLPPDPNFPNGRYVVANITAADTFTCVPSTALPPGGPFTPNSSQQYQISLLTPMRRDGLRLTISLPSQLNFRAGETIGLEAMISADPNFPPGPLIHTGVLAGVSPFTIVCDATPPSTLPAGTVLVAESASYRAYLSNATSVTGDGGDTLTVNTREAHNLAAGDVIWLDSSTPDQKFPRGPYSVVAPGAVDPASTVFKCKRSGSAFPSQTASGAYRYVVGNGIYAHGGDANSITSTGCIFQGNSGWGVLEDSAGGNVYVGCAAEANSIGPYYAQNAAAQGNVFLGCYSEQGQHPAEIGSPAIVIGGVHGAGLKGGGLFIVGETSTRLAFRNDTGGFVRLGDRGAGPSEATRYMEFHNATDGLDVNTHLSIDFDQAQTYQRMLGFGQYAEGRMPAFLVTGRSSFHGGRGLPIDPGTLVIGGPTGEGRFWLGMTRHETVFKMPDKISHPSDTWSVGDRAWNRGIEWFFNVDAAFLGVGSGAQAAEGWICAGGAYVFAVPDPANPGRTKNVTWHVKGGTLGEYSEGLTATADGTSGTVLLSGRTGQIPGSSRLFLQPGMYIVIKNTLCVIKSISVLRDTLNVDWFLADSTSPPADKPPKGSGLPIRYNPPDFHRFGNIALLPDTAASSPPAAGDFIVALLPKPPTFKVVAGARGFVSDSTTTTFGAVVLGGGTNFVPVFFDGRDWRIG